jgi:hypothetical protein
MDARPANWQSVISQKPLPELVSSLAACRFKGIYLDRFGYDDRAASVEMSLRRVLGTAPLVSGDGRLSFFSLSVYTRRFDARHSRSVRRAACERTLHPLMPIFGSGFYVQEHAAGRSFRWANRKSSLILVNPRSLGQARLKTIVASGYAEPAELTVRLPDNSSRTYAITSQGTQIDLELRLHSGTNLVHFETTAAEVPAGRASGRRLFITFYDFSVQP